jgi:hypothetical protein
MTSRILTLALLLSLMIGLDRPAAAQRPKPPARDPHTLPAALQWLWQGYPIAAAK